MYGRRVGHALRPHHKSLMRDLLPSVALPEAGPLDLRALFPGATGFAFEIGFGGGEHLAAQSQAHPRITSYNVCYTKYYELVKSLGGEEEEAAGHRTVLTAVTPAAE